MKGIVARGRAAFDSDDIGTRLSGAAPAVEILTHGTCDGYLAPPTFRAAH